MGRKRYVYEGEDVKDHIGCFILVRSTVEGPVLMPVAFVKVEDVEEEKEKVVDKTQCPTCGVEHEHLPPTIIQLGGGRVDVVGEGVTSSYLHGQLIGQSCQPPVPEPLKPCWNCRSEMRISRVTVGFYAKLLDPDAKAWAAVCECGVQGPSKTSEAEASAAWNRGWNNQIGA